MASWQCCHDEYSALTQVKVMCTIKKQHLNVCVKSICSEMQKSQPLPLTLHKRIAYFLNFASFIHQSNILLCTSNLTFIWVYINIATENISFSKPWWVLQVIGCRLISVSIVTANFQATWHRWPTEGVIPFGCFMHISLYRGTRNLWILHILITDILNLILFPYSSCDSLKSSLATKSRPLSSYPRFSLCLLMPMSDDILFPVIPSSQKLINVHPCTNNPGNINNYWHLQLLRCIINTVISVLTYSHMSTLLSLHAHCTGKKMLI